jgi:hypothetical protein
MQRTKITFMTTLGRNVGDEFIREGIRSFFDSLGFAYDAYYVCKHDLTTLSMPTADEPGRLADKFVDADVVVQSGAPVYWCNGIHRSYTADWHEPLWQQRILKLGPARPILNLGAGAGQKSTDDLSSMLGDQSLISFARHAGDACRLTTTRDPLANQFLTQAGVVHHAMPCPAFHAARRFDLGRAARPGDLIAVNLMKLAGHFRMKPQTSAEHWRSVIDATLPRLRDRGRLLFVAHDRAEADFANEFRQDDEFVFLAADFRDYLSIYSRVRAFVGNRVHGGVVVAGFGRPAVIIGNDARIGIAAPIGVPAIDSADVSPDWIIDRLDEQLADVDRLWERRISFRESSAQQYEQLIRRAVPELFKASSAPRQVA